MCFSVDETRWISENMTLCVCVYKSINRQIPLLIPFRGSARGKVTLFLKTYRNHRKKTKNEKSFFFILVTLELTVRGNKQVFMK